MGTGTISARPSARFNFAHLLHAAFAREDGLTKNPAADAVAVDDAAMEVDGAVAEGMGTDGDATEDECAGCNTVHSERPNDTMQRAATPVPKCTADAACRSPTGCNHPIPFPDSTAPHSTSTAAPLPTSPAPKPSRKEWRRIKEKRHKSAKRDAKKLLLQASSSQGALLANHALVTRHLEAAVNAHQTALASADLPHTATGYQGLKGDGEEKRLFGLEELVGEGSRFGFDLERWDGRCVPYIPFTHPCNADLNPPLARKSIPILDSLCRVLSVCSGQPRDPDWQTAVNERGSTKLATARRQCEFADDALHHRCGNFAAMAIGVSYGGGQQVQTPPTQRPAPC